MVTGLSVELKVWYCHIGFLPLLEAFLATEDDLYYMCIPSKIPEAALFSNSAPNLRTSSMEVKSNFSMSRPINRTLPTQENSLYATPKPEDATLRPNRRVTSL